MKDERLKLILRKDLKRKKDGKCPVHLRVNMNSKSMKLSTNTVISEEDWNYTTNFPKKRNDLDATRQALRRKLKKVTDFLFECDKYDRNYSLKDIKENYNNGSKKTFFDYYWDFCRKKSKDVTEGTLYVYKVLGNQLYEYEPSLKLGDISYAFIEDFFDYLINCKDVNNLFNKRKCLVTFLNKMIKRGLVKRNFASEYTLPKRKLKDVYLTKDELKAFSEVDVKGAGLEITQDVFEFCCLTGLRYGDAFSLTNKEIKGSYIRKEQQKVKTYVQIPLKRRAIEILEKYDYKCKKGNIFPRRENQTCNRDVKKIASLAGIEKNLTFHISRHTFGSRLAESNVTAFIIQKMMGHGCIKTTSRYIKTNLSTLNNAMENVCFV